MAFKLMAAQLWQRSQAPLRCTQGFRRFSRSLSTLPRQSWPPFQSAITRPKPLPYHMPPVSRVLQPTRSILDLLSVNVTMNAIGVGINFDPLTRHQLDKERPLPDQIKLLASKPVHTYQERGDDRGKVWSLFREPELKDHACVVGVYVTGDPACGKSQFVREFGESYFDHEAKKNKQLVVATLSARSESHFWRFYYRLALELGCPLHSLTSALSETDRLSVISTEVQKELRNRPGWMLIVEGIDENNAAKYQPFLPQPGSENWGRGKVLIATTDENLIQRHNKYARHHQLDPLSLEARVDLLNTMVGDQRGSEEEAEKIVKSAKTPVGIVSAGTYIKDARIQYTDYLKRLEDGQLSPQKVSAEAAKKHAETHPHLKKVFTVLAYCPPEQPLPLSVIYKFLKIKPDSKEAKEIKDCHLLMRNEHEAQDTFDVIARVFVNQPTHDTFKDAFKEDSQEQKEIVKGFITCMLEEYESESRSPELSSAWSRLMLVPHMEEFLETSKELGLKQHIQLCVALSNAFTEKQSPEGALDVLKSLLRYLKDKEIKHLKPEEWAMIHLGFGKAYRQLGEYEKSGKSLTEALEEQQYLQANEAMLVADILKEFSATVFSYGEFFQSKEYLESALNVYEKEEAIHPIETLSSLAHLCIKTGDWVGGLKYLEEAKHHLHQGQSDSTSTLAARENLGVVYTELGDHEKSVQLLEEVVTECRKINFYDPQHVALAVPLAKLTAAYYGDRQSDQKRDQAFDQLVDLGNIPLAALETIGAAAFEFGDIETARRLQEVIGTLKITKPPQLLLGKLYRLTGNLNQAERILETALQDSEEMYGVNHIRVGKILAQLGKVYEDQGYCTKSLQTLERAWHIHEDFYGTRAHPEVAFVRGDLARVVQRTGDGVQGTHITREVLALYDQIIDKQAKNRQTFIHAMKAQILTNYALILRDTKKLDEAEIALRDALTLQDKLLADNSLPRIRTIYTLGTVLDRQNKNEEAEKHMTEAHRLLKPIGHDHPYFATISTGLGRFLLRKTRDILRAHSFITEALEIRTNDAICCGENHTQVAKCHHYLGEIHLTTDTEFYNIHTAHDHFLTAHGLLAYLVGRETSQQTGVTFKLAQVTFVDDWKNRMVKAAEELRKINRQ